MVTTKPENNEPIPRAGMHQTFWRACPKRWLVPRILNGLSWDQACPLIIPGLVQILNGLSWQQACPLIIPGRVTLPFERQRVSSHWIWTLYESNLKASAEIVLKMIFDWPRTSPKLPWNLSPKHCEIFNVDPPPCYWKLWGLWASPRLRLRIAGE